MRVKSAIDLWFKAIIIVVIGIMIITVVFLTFATRFTVYALVMSCASVLVASAFLLWLWVGTYYEFCGDHLYCRSGPFWERIKYDNIKYLGLSENMRSSMALSTQRIEIRQHCKGYITGTTMISPENREIFLAQLICLCSNLEPTEQLIVER